MILGASPAGPTAVSVPGKLILMGEHAVVYDRPALVAAVGLRSTVTLDSGEGAEVGIDLPQVGVRERIPAADVSAYADRTRTAWHAFRESPGTEAFRRVRGGDPAHVVKVALGEAARVAGEARLAGLRVRVDSAIPIGTGFGSSAATAVGVVASYLVHAGMHSDPSVIDRVALDVERRQHGLPSGVDHATVLRGGVTWAQRAPGGDVSLEPLVPVSALRNRLRVYDTGTPTESTGEVVSAVRSRLEAAPRDGAAVLDRMEDATRAFRDQFTQRSEDPPTVLECIRAYQACLVQLGVVPDTVGEVVRRIERAGGAAKISGAGALRGPGAGCLIVYHPDPDAIGTWPFLEPFRPHDVRIGVEGLRGEDVR